MINKKEIERLVKKYEKLTSNELKKYNEARTCNDFILPFFQALGWDTLNKFSNDLLLEEKVAKKRVDLAFFINEVTKFFVEVKSIKVDLQEEKWAEQAVMYAWHKSVPWAVLTDFESIKVFNAEWDEPDVQQSLVFEISYKNYLTDKRLLWLSKESIKKGELNNYAEENFKKPKREPVDKQLANDLVSWRGLLFNNLKSWNSDEKIENKHFADAVQKILNRFIFIRTTEDRDIEDQKLREIVRIWQEKEYEYGFILKELKKLFKYYWSIYDGKLFKEHFCDFLKYEDGILALIINQLYKNKKGIHYNFAEIGADVLGSVYEQYLGQIQESEEQRKLSKRKSQGIYYTPRYIVDYIVKNTLGEVLKNTSFKKALKIKIIDPACGSGSFLIKAFETLDSFLKNTKNQINTTANNYKRKLNILTSNIYGVDLDKEAVEIAELNLLLKVLEKRVLLPNLSHNIEYGNSLISGTEKELKKYFKRDWKLKRSFDWTKKFPEVFKEGGFDVVVGNPPYIDSEEMTKKDKNFRLYCCDKYESAKGNWDIFCVFIQKGLDLLKKEGYLGMIVPNKLLSADYAESIRNIIKRYSIISINDYSTIKVFGASVYPIVIIIKKVKPKSDHYVNINIFGDSEGDIKLIKKQKIKQVSLEKYKKSWSPIFSRTEDANFLERIIKKSKPLKELLNIHEAATVSEAYELKKVIKDLRDEEDYYRFINTGTIDRYISLWKKEKTRYIKSTYSKPIVLKKSLEKFFPKRYESAKKSKVIVAGMSKKIECFLDEKGEYLPGKSTVIIEDGDINLLKFILAILNSKLLTFIYKNIFRSLSLEGGYLRIGALQIKELPILFDRSKSLEIIKKTDKIIELSKKLQKLDSFMDEKEYKETEEEIKRTNEDLDVMVYKLYSLNKEEIKIIESAYREI